MDNGWRFATRTEQDAEVITERLKARGGRPASRRQRRIVLLAVAALLAAWGVWTLLVG